MMRLLRNKLRAWALWPYWSFRNRFTPTTCGNACEWVYPYGFVPEADCPIHDKDEDEGRINTSGKFTCLHLCPGDVLVLKVDCRLPTEDIIRIRSKLEDVFPNNDILVLDKGMDIGVIKIQQGAWTMNKFRSQDIFMYASLVIFAVLLLTFVALAVANVA